MSARPSQQKSAQSVISQEVDQNAASAPTTQKRVFGQGKKLIHDLFKLSVAKMRRNDSWNEERPIYIELEHCHIFHTIDSSGRKQDTCSPVGGHHHKMTVTYSADGAPTVTCSPAMKYVRKRVNGENTRVLVEIEDDDHTHEVEYIRSEEIEPRRVSAEWIKLQSEMIAKQEPKVDGVIG